MRKYLFTALFLFACAGSMLAQKSADAYAELFNEHLNKGLKSGITLSVDLPLYAYNTNVYTLQDTVTGGPAGYMYEGYTIVDSVQIDSAAMCLHKGIDAFPNRLDLYLGLASMHLYCLDTEAMLNVLEQAMKQEKKNKGKWLWTADEKLSKEYDILFDRIQEDFKRFLDAEELDNAERLVRTAMRYFPKRAEYMNDLGVVYVYREDIEGALECYRKALKLAPKDELIKDNIEYLEQVLKNED